MAGGSFCPDDRAASQLSQAGHQESSCIGVVRCTLRDPHRHHWENDVRSDIGNWDDLHGRVTDCSAAGFAMAMDVSCHSFIRVARLAEPLMRQGGCLLTVSFYGSERVVEHCNLMGPVKAALESTTRYLAAELGPRDIRVHSISPGPMRTRAASGLDRFDELLERAAAQAPQKRLASLDDVGAHAAYLVGDGARMLSGTVIPVDGGQHVMAG